MYYTDIATIEYPFLYDAAMVINKFAPIKSIYMDKNGKIAFTLKGKLTDKEVKRVLMNINPFDSCEEDYDLTSLNYSYSNDMQNTYVYSADGIDYRKL